MPPSRSFSALGKPWVGSGQRAAIGWFNVSEWQAKHGRDGSRRLWPWAFVEASSSLRTRAVRPARSAALGCGLRAGPAAGTGRLAPTGPHRPELPHRPRRALRRPHLGGHAMNCTLQLHNGATIPIKRAQAAVRHAPAACRQSSLAPATWGRPWHAGRGCLAPSRRPPAHGAAPRCR